ncbi:polysaccharide lyase 6 family protein [Gilvimarinus sp. SDUM040013]|uniref:Polysaccharide lyase 6 family protein n=1 Tax=Gilvimarinus gilvus TaxID=3058038 RepID=A0ABU4S0A6_9GAMM|nr:polysaccharide lyase 6 family protein [Gilvimarinus sp. SDUM040013]MDO3385908.1 polysaccharide lyase 6 family protein [Gilvimarinus sp. SDUM040013]MDX6850589.1 polysaccharide lyase 6 family protein [Gilvimarinus sp. SDUM040013]
MNNNIAVISGLLVLSFICAASSAKDYEVADFAEYQSVVAKLEPGDRVLLEDGHWRDVEFVFSARGTQTNPITLAAANPGKAIISGRSNLKLAGEHLVVRGLVFKDGYTPTDSVISFRTAKPKSAEDYSTVAVNTRLTEVVIDDFSNPDRYETDYWVSVYGKNNRIDHNHFSFKRNKGVTMAVRLDTVHSRENNHVIDYNYFGPRPVLGSNGGETLRIGTSHFSLSDSLTTVAHNYFEHCDGEVEIISNKSGKNVLKNNVFFESRGTLTLRHGNGNLVEGNAFIGNGVDHTGGIRVINADQVIRNNYLSGLAGSRFGGGLVVMNGVPDSPINRYHQVDNAMITGNTLVNVERIIFGAGSDEERSAVPSNSRFIGNTIINESMMSPFELHDSVKGIDFAENRVNFEVEEALQGGFAKISNVELAVPELPVKKSEVGVAWYPKYEKSDRFINGKSVSVAPGTDTVIEAYGELSSAGELLLDEGDYHFSKTLMLDKALVIRGAGKGKTRLTFARKSLVDMLNGSALRLQDLSVSGLRAPDDKANAVIRSDSKPMNKNMQLELLGVEIRDLDINKDFDVIKLRKSTFADNVVVKASSFVNIKGTVLKLDTEKDDYGMYNAEYINVENSQLSNVTGGLMAVYRGGTDESTFGPHVHVDRVSLESSPAASSTSSSILLHGVQRGLIENSKFDNSAPILVRHTVGGPVIRIEDNVYKNNPLYKVESVVSGMESTFTANNNSLLGDQP